MVVSLASVDNTADEVVVFKVPHIFLAPSTISFCLDTCLGLLQLSSEVLVAVVSLFVLGVSLGRDCLFNAGFLFGLVSCVAATFA